MEHIKSEKCICEFCGQIKSSSKLFIKYLNYPFIVEQQIGIISSYVLPGVYDVISNLKKKNPNDYILCIGYNTKPKDFQIGLTGSVKFKENHKTAAMREAVEEACIISDKFEYIKGVSFGKNRRSYVYNVQARLCKTVNDISKDQENDNVQQKVTVLIYGSLEDITRIMNQSPLESNNKEKIGYYAAVKILSAFKICRLMSEKKLEITNTNVFIRWNC